MGTEKTLRIAIDTGGTFTDCVYLHEGTFAVRKVFSTPANPALAVLDALNQIVPNDRLAPNQRLVLRHGTTVGTNTLLERRGARVAFVTTEGFEDTIAIGRQARAKLYDWFQPAPQCLVPEELRFGVAERVSAEGLVIKPVSEADLEELLRRIQQSGTESIALSLLFGFANPVNEAAVAAHLGKLRLPLSVSHLVLPEFREYERGSTVVANAYLAPRMGSYLNGLAKGVAERYEGARFEVMQSSGGIIPGRLAASQPVRTVLSGPAGGVIGAYKLAALAGFDRVIGFDMGGTSTDVCLVDGTQADLQTTNEAVVAGVPISVPMLDIHTVGAGGGSIARFDAGGLLRVGPASAGADPGPICFGKGEQPTVTDANLVLGRLDVDRFLGGSVGLEVERTRDALQKSKGSLSTAEAFSAGILQVVEASMGKAIRVISVERGYDPRDFTLVAFGGGGPVHACALAHALEMPRVLVPVLPGALSALGILLADTTREYSLTVMQPADASFEEVFAELERTAVADFAEEQLEGVARRSLDMRYKGQGFDLNLTFGPHYVRDFHALHERRYGFANPGAAVEVVNVRLRMTAAAPPYQPEPKPLREGDGAQAVCGSRSVYFDGSFQPTRLYDRERLQPGDRFQGPAIVAEYSSATVLPPGDELRVDGFGNLVIEVNA